MKHFSLKPWIQLLPFIRAEKKAVWMAVSSTVVMAVGDVLLPLWQSRAVDQFLLKASRNGVGQYILLYLVLAVCQVGGIILFCRSGFLLEMGTAKGMKDACFRNLQQLSMDYYAEHGVGHILSRVMSDTDRIATQIGWNVTDFIWGMIYIVGVYAVLLYLNPVLAGMLLVIAPVVAALTLYFQSRLVKQNREVRERHSRITSAYNEGITGVRTAKMLAVSKKLQQEFQNETAAYVRASLIHGHIRSLYVPLVILCGSIGACAMLAFGGKQVIAGTMSIGTLSAFVSYSLGLFDVFRNQAQRLSNLISLQACVERVTQLVHEVPTVQDTQEAIEKYGDMFHPKLENWEKIEGTVEFEDVSFTYPDGGEEVLSHFNLHIPQGSTVAIVGETGAGKSTIVNLICRFYEPTHGKVKIDGVDIRERSQLWLHSHIGYVLQSPHLFSGTLLDNIRYGRPEASDAEVMEAARAVCVDQIAQQLPNGLYTQVGECGDRLSAGEKQLISFARALLAKPKLFILDEATSAVDTITEKHLQEATKLLMRDTTSFVIAHRLSTIREADLILVVSGGKIVEKGTHESLLHENGKYAELVRAQQSIWKENSD